MNELNRLRDAAQSLGSAIKKAEFADGGEVRIKLSSNPEPKESGTGGWYIALGKISSQQITLWYDKWLGGNKFDYWLGCEASERAQRRRISALLNSSPELQATQLKERFVAAGFEHLIRRPAPDLLKFPVLEEYPRVTFFGMYDTGEHLNVPRAARFLASISPAFALTDAEAQTLSTRELRKRALLAGNKPQQFFQRSPMFVRNAAVKEYVKRLAAVFCDLCEQAAPFKTQKGGAYLESHHIVWLAHGGEDSVRNSVALCPNCHRRMHIIGSKADINKLTLRAGARL
jgi:hypothetical protein